MASALPSTTAADDIPTATVLLPAADKSGNAADPNGARYLLGPAQLTGKVVSTANALPPDLSVYQPNWYVQVKFTGSGGPQFDKLAQDNYQKFVAIALDGVVESAPQIQTQTFNGQAVINGSNFTEGQAKNLALELRYGSLPVQFKPQSIQTVSATIGKDSLRAGLVAGAIGLLLVLLLHALLLPGPRPGRGARPDRLGDAALLHHLPAERSRGAWPCPWPAPPASSSRWVSPPTRTSCISNV